MDMIELLNATWPYIATLLNIAVTVATTIHILYMKRNTRAAAGWLGLVWFAPLLGVILYWLFGVNRIKRRARLRFASKQSVSLPEKTAAVSAVYIEQLYSALKENGLEHLSRMTDKLTRQPLLKGNRIAPLINGDQAYPAMLSSIDEARHSIALCSYIFDNDTWGSRFRSALRNAKMRGIDVKVLVDSVGARYSFPPITWGLRRDTVDAAEFLRTLLPWRFNYFNLRNHRKILVIDGRIGFTGGLNIRDGNCLRDNPSHPVQDIHFRIDGPVVAELQRTFAEDWTFTTGEVLSGEKWYPHLEPQGNCVARGISDGPDEDFDNLRMVILSAVATARSSIRIISPYFIPDDELVSALRIACLRNIDIEILLPAESNLKMVKWASDASLEELLQQGCRIYLTAPPFDHSKIMVVDEAWVLLGSANWDSRSLALNFEFNMECYDLVLARLVNEIFEEKKYSARELPLEEVQSRHLLMKLRNRLFRLFAPYL